MRRTSLIVVLLLALSACNRPSPDATPQSAVDAPAPAPVRRDAHATATHWQCGGLTVSTHFDDESLESITLQIPDRTLTLKSMAEEDGARFADAVGNEFWSRPGKVTLALAGQPTAACVKRRSSAEAPLRGDAASG